MRRTLPVPLLAIALAAPAFGDGAAFRIVLDPALGTGPVGGRLIISVVRPDSKLGKGVDPNDGPFWEDQQPLFGIDIRELGASTPLEVREADYSSEPLSGLKPGEYRAAARLITKRGSSSWRNDAGNLFSEAVAFSVTDGGGAGAMVDIRLSRETKERAWPTGDASHGAELVEVRSALLSAFHGREVMLRAGIVKPAHFDPSADQKYAAIYEVPGFGGDHFGAIGDAARRGPESSRMAMGDAGRIDAAAFTIVLDPESPNGHTLFADSANNGPCGRALIEELIPAIEGKFRLVAKPEARLLRGHSSGGWSTVWLLLNYPETFGATWSTSPDPVDFRRLQTVDLYGQDSMYRMGGVASQATDQQLAYWQTVPGALVAAVGSDTGFLLGSYRRGGGNVMTIRQECRGEDVLGPDNTSGQQWDSWFAVWGPRDGRGRPTALFDPTTGAIDKAVAEQYRKYDIGAMLRGEPGKYGPLFRERVRLVVGDADNFFLNEAVALLKADLDRIGKDQPGGPGYVKIVPKLDHGTIFRSAEVRAFPGEMLAHLKANGLLPDSHKP